MVSSFELPARRRRTRPSARLHALADTTLIASVLGLSKDAGLELTLPQLLRETATVQLARAAALDVSAGEATPTRRSGAQHLSPSALQRLTHLVELLRRVRSGSAVPAEIRCSQDVLAWADTRLVHLEHEELWLLCLDGKNALLAAERVAQGGLHGCGVTPRDVLRPAVRNGAAAVVVVHNHPSGDPTPSHEDVAMTEQLAQACAVLGLPLLDHVVVARGGARSAVGAPRSALAAPR